MFKGVELHLLLVAIFNRLLVRVSHRSIQTTGPISVSKLLLRRVHLIDRVLRSHLLKVLIDLVKILILLDLKQETGIHIS